MPSVTVRDIYMVLCFAVRCFASQSKHLLCCQQSPASSRRAAPEDLFQGALIDYGGTKQSGSRQGTRDFPIVEGLLGLAGRRPIS